MAVVIICSISLSLIALLLLIAIYSNVKIFKRAIGTLGNAAKANPYSLDHLVGVNIKTHLPPELIQSPIRFLLLVTPSCGSCYETMEEITQRLTRGVKPDYVKCLLLNDSEEHLDYFLKRYGASFWIEVIDSSLIDQMAIKILPCLLRIDDEGNIEEATIHIWKMEAYVKGGEKDVEHAG
ncbi:hypothetical protein [Brevibacillus parabrevis]|uniref:hypothetical protein n=1 Tax=Brevibacillus parabrevis TaxID=54914 RepID=UPI0028D1BB7F|nr:hypothetical protein [Brevibacillus parabrevis]